LVAKSKYDRKKLAPVMNGKPKIRSSGRSSGDRESIGINWGQTTFDFEVLGVNQLSILTYACVQGDP